MKKIQKFVYFDQVLVEGDKNNHWLEGKASITKMENYSFLMKPKTKATIHSFSVSQQSTCACMHVSKGECVLYVSVQLHSGPVTVHLCEVLGQQDKKTASYAAIQATVECAEFFFILRNT